MGLLVGVPAGHFPSGTSYDHMSTYFMYNRHISDDVMGRSSMSVCSIIDVKEKSLTKKKENELFNSFKCSLG